MAIREINGSMGGAQKKKKILIYDHAKNVENINIQNGGWGLKIRMSIECTLISPLTKTQYLVTISDNDGDIDSSSSRIILTSFSWRVAW